MWQKFKNLFKKKREYTCALCGETYLATNTEEETFKECAKEFGCVPPKENRLTVCDDCYDLYIAKPKSINLQ